ncbi:MAG: hypothetical protein FWG87_06675 [Defluviitaleaceae bacterium]|nr:hypothetical protein [Defluviitaleaceae bacterium]
MKKILILKLMLLLVVSCTPVKNTTTTENSEYPPSLQAELPTFDPLEPTGWDVLHDVIDLEQAREFIFNKGKNIVHEVDSFIAGFDLGMTLDEAVLNFQNEEYTENIIDNAGFTSKEVTFGGITLTFWDIGFDDEWIIMAIDVFGTELETARGLRVGDTAEKVFDLYGTPVAVVDADNPWLPNAWQYRRELGDIYITCNITVVDGVVQRIRFNGFP